MTENKKRINIVLSEGILNSIDKNARIQGISRSAYITQLEQMENYRTQMFIERNKSDENDYYLDLPLSNPYLKSIFDE